MLVGLAAITLLLVAAGCGDDEAAAPPAPAEPAPAGPDPAEPAPSPPAEPEGGVPAEIEEIVAQGYEGRFDLPPETGPAAQTGKNVWFISCGQAFAACANMAKDFEEAGGVLGWSVNVVDGAADPNKAADLIRQAIAAQADGVALVAFDCPGIRTALLEAKQANMPVVGNGSLDCNEEVFGGEGEPLFGGKLNMMGSFNPGDYYYNWSIARAQFLCSKLGGEGKVLSVVETSQAIHQSMGAGFEDGMASSCPNVEVVPVEFTFAQVPDVFTQIVQSALVDNPDAAALAEDTDALMFLGLEPAIAQSAPEGMIVAGAEGLPQNIDLMREGVQDTSTYLPFDWFIWGTADALNRIFAGEDPETIPNAGGGWQYIDPEHNLPASGPFVPSVDFKAAFTKVWQGE